MEKRDLRERCCRARLLELQQRHQHSGGQDKGKITGSNLTGQTGSSSGLTSPQGGLTGAQTYLTDCWYFLTFTDRIRKRMEDIVVALHPESIQGIINSQGTEVH